MRKPENSQESFENSCGFCDVAFSFEPSVLKGKMENRPTVRERKTLPQASRPLTKRVCLLIQRPTLLNLNSSSVHFNLNPILIIHKWKKRPWRENSISAEIGKTGFFTIYLDLLSTGVKIMHWLIWSSKSVGLRNCLFGKQSEDIHDSLHERDSCLTVPD